MRIQSLLMAGSAFVLFAFPASAQNTSSTGQPDAVADSAQRAPDDIIVTAQRRSENAQRTALAVTAIDGESLIERGVRDLQDLQHVTPSLSFADSGILKFVNIRGVGLNLQSPTVVSGVATYRDGLFSPSPIFLNEGLFDIAGVEVLRGPQGTFVGQNSTGGAIFQKTVSPELNTFTANGVLTAGNYDLLKAEGGVTLPLGSTLAMRVAGSVERRDSFYRNIGPGDNEPGRVRQESARVGLLWEPDSSLSLLLKSEINMNDNDGYPGKPIPGTRFAAFAPADPFTLNYDRTDTRREELSSRTSLEANYRFDNDLTIRFIGGFQYGYQHFLNDLDGSSVAAVHLEQKIHDYVYSGEVNIISPDDGRFKWVVGGSFVRQIANLNVVVINAEPPFSGIPFPNQRTVVDARNPKDAVGAFAQGTFELTDGLSIDIGGRVSRDTQSQSGSLTLLPMPPMPGVIDASNPRYADTQVTGKLALNWQVDPDNFLYAFVANGFKAGGVNFPDGTFRPEKIVDYEAGWKSDWFGGRLRTQLGGFYNDYRDLQLTIFSPATGQSVISNAGASEIYGAEFQAQARIRGLELDGSLAYVHSRIGQLAMVDTRALPGGSAQGLGVQCAPGVPSNPPFCFDYQPFLVNLDGKRNPFSPKWTANIGAGYTFDLANGDAITPRIDFSYMGAQSTSLFENPMIDILEERELLNVQLAYTRGSFTFTGYATNLTNQVYRIGNEGNNTYYGAPRQYGLRIAARY